MSIFTDDELRFLSWYRISPADVYDGRGESQEVRRWKAKAAGAVLILGPRCYARGHRLRTRSHHCMQCNPKNLAFQNRYNSPGYVYIAGTQMGRVIKIGTASDIMQREHQLKAEAHAGFSDWEMLFSIKVDQAGRVEHESSSRLDHKRVYRPYIKDGLRQTAIEVLECTFNHAYAAIEDTVGDPDDYETWQWTRAGEYNFGENDVW